MVERGGIGPAARRAALLLSAIVAVACTAPNVSEQTIAPAEATATPAAALTSAPVATVALATPTPQPTLTPQPTDPPTTAPPTTTAPTTRAPTTPAPTASGALILEEAAIARHLDALAAIAEAHGGERSPDSDGYDASVDYVAEQLVQFGFNVERPPIEFTSFRETAPVALTIGQQSWSGPDWLHANIYSGSGDVSGVPVRVGVGCSPGDWSGFDRGRIALVDAGECATRQKVIAAQSAGARAIVGLSTWGQGMVLQPTLGDPSDIEIPAVVAGQEPAAALVEAARDGRSIDISVQVELPPATDRNVVAERRGTTDTVVMLGAHLDSVLGGPGLNDNGSGVATILALAEAVGARPPPHATIRVAFWAAEEFGLHGSRSYVVDLSEPERSRISAYLNLDMVASPNAGLYVYQDDEASPRSAALSQSLLTALAEIGRQGRPIPAGGSSDHFYFELYGVPTSGVFSGIAPLTPDEADVFGGEAGLPADACYHLPCDDLSNVDTGTALTFGRAIAAVVEDLAY